MEPLALLGLAGAGLLAGAVNTIAGGGSLIGLPALILLGGLSPSVANGTNRVGVILQSVVATTQFHREGMLDVRASVKLLPVTALGSGVGAWVSAGVPDEVFKPIIGVAMLAMLAVVIFKPQRFLEAREAPLPGWVGQLIFLGVGLYGGFLQAGVGVFLLAALSLSGGLDLVRANAVKALLVAGFTVPPLAIFMAADLIAWAPGLVMAAGSMVGAWLGTKMTVSWGPRFVRWVLVVVVLLSSVKLLAP